MQQPRSRADVYFAPPRRVYAVVCCACVPFFMVAAVGDRPRSGPTRQKRFDWKKSTVLTRQGEWRPAGASR